MMDEGREYVSQWGERVFNYSTVENNGARLVFG